MRCRVTNTTVSIVSEDPRRFHFEGTPRPMPPGEASALLGYDQRLSPP